MEIEKLLATVGLQAISHLGGGVVINGIGLVENCPSTK